MSVDIQYRPLTTVQYTVVSPRVWFWVKEENIQIIKSRVHTYAETAHDDIIYTIIILITIESSLQQ